MLTAADHSQYSIDFGNARAVSLAVPFRERRIGRKRPLAGIQAAGIMAAGMGEAHMFWKRKPSAEQPVPAKERFETAKEATRRAVFLSVAQGMTADDDYKRQLSELVLTCRSAAVTSGTSTGHSEVEIDAAIASLCDADVSRMRNATDQEFVAYTQESGEIVKRFLSTE